MQEAVRRSEWHREEEPPTRVEGAGREGMGFAKTALLCFGALCVALVTKKGEKLRDFF